MPLSFSLYRLIHRHTNTHNSITLSSALFSLLSSLCYNLSFTAVSSSSSSVQKVPSTSSSIITTMAKLAAFLVLMFLSITSGGNVIMVNGQKTWCVAKPSSDQATLLANINYACSQVDCRILQKGCPCSSPDNLMNHASIAMNLYYQSRGKNHWNCDFRASGLVVVTDPSYGNCIYA